MTLTPTPSAGPVDSGRDDRAGEGAEEEHGAPACGGPRGGTVILAENDSNNRKTTV